MNTTIFMRGLMASGKSTLSKKFLNEKDNFARVNKDDLREMLKNKSNTLAAIFDSGKLSKMMFMDSRKNIDNNLVNVVQNALIQAFDPPGPLYKAMRAKTFGPKEKFIIKMESVILKWFVKCGKNIIIDNTGYNTEHLSRAKQICQGYEFEIIDMHRDYGVTLEQCIERNKNRKNKVPEIAIYAMNKKYNVIGAANDPNGNKPYKTDNRVAIFDVDGTLSNIDHRKHFIEGGKKDWDGFFKNMANDELIETTKQLIDLTYPNHDIVIVTGRPSSYRQVTEDWLKKHNVRYNALFMRGANDHRSDVIVKQEILDNFLDKSKIDMVVDDRKKILDMWRSNGLPTINVGGPNNDF